MVAKRVVYSRQASRTLARIPTNESKRIIAKIEQYAGDPSSQAKNVVKLQGRPGYRLRVGDWRVIFDEDDKVLDVEKIASRGNVY
ncbi:type II toxin-antitoxin system RelE/ParE family toxin [Mycoplana sp. MJR14]|nr:type II toxin-antitoxin system RelE/ParE family toxin [Mycoplana sp. MJR14]MDF1634736.1 type II toxin-antitoxin system RelE/ParE family toxin [Mycoplana sp. MJR14]